MLIRSFVATAVAILLTLSAFAQTKLLRFPDIYGDRVVFTYGGDLWTASTSGGAATRLTAHPGVETYAKFSPDGRWIAFTGQYDGDEQVYVIPSNGGEPRQLIHVGAFNLSLILRKLIGAGTPREWRNRTPRLISLFLWLLQARNGTQLRRFSELWPAPWFSRSDHPRWVRNCRSRNSGGSATGC